MIFLGVIFVCCVIFFPSGVWGTIKNLSLRGRRKTQIAAETKVTLSRKPLGDRTNG
jgi:hypothetical protein